MSDGGFSGYGVCGIVSAVKIIQRLLNRSNQLNVLNPLQVDLVKTAFYMFCSYKVTKPFDAALKMFYSLVAPTT